MEKIRFAILGAGWRAAYYARVTEAIPELFEITDVLVHSEETKERWLRKHNTPIAFSLETVLAKKPSFVVLAISKPSIADMLCLLMEQGIPVLCETPPAILQEKLTQIAAVAKSTKAKVQVAEQYLQQPFYAAWEKAVQDGLLGKVSNMTVSTVHGYHAVALMRRFLGIGHEGGIVTGKRSFFPVCHTASRQGIAFAPEAELVRRDRAEIVFDSGKTAYYDFSPEQYYSYIRSKQFNVQGTHGEIDNFSICYVNSDGDAVCGNQLRRDLGIYQIQDWSHFGIELNGRFLYKNRFVGSRINDDETAIAECLYQMNEFVHGRKSSGYSLAEAMQDAYIALQIEEAMQNAYQPVHFSGQLWECLEN